MSGRVYTIKGANITLANQAVTLVFMNPSTTVGFKIIRCWISQTGSTTEAQIAVQLNTQVTAFPTVVSATPGKHKLSDPPANMTGNTTGAAGTCGINASDEGAGAKTIILADAFSNLNGWLYIPTEDEKQEINANASSGFGLHLPVAPATLSGWYFGVTYQELG